MNDLDSRHSHLEPDFKNLIIQRYQDWMDCKYEKVTTDETLKSPPRRKVLAWMCESWRLLGKEFLLQSVRHIRFTYKLVDLMLGSYIASKMG